MLYSGFVKVNQARLIRILDITTLILLNIFAILTIHLNIRITYKYSWRKVTKIHMSFAILLILVVVFPFLIQNSYMFSIHLFLGLPRFLLLPLLVSLILLNIELSPVLTVCPYQLSCIFSIKDVADSWPTRCLMFYLVSLSHLVFPDYLPQE